MPIAANCVCHSRAEQYSRWAPNLCCGVCGVTKPGSSKIEAILGRHTILLSCGKSALQSWLNLANSLMTKERPYVFRSSLGAIWTPQDWHEMVSASAGLSCMTSHGVGTCWCHSFSVLKSPAYCSGLAERTSRRILVVALQRRLVGSTACHRTALAASAGWCVPLAEPAWKTFVWRHGR